MRETIPRLMTPNNFYSTSLTTQTWSIHFLENVTAKKKTLIKICHKTTDWMWQFLYVQQSHTFSSIKEIFFILCLPQVMRNDTQLHSFSHNGTEARRKVSPLAIDTSTLSCFRTKIQLDLAQQSILSISELRVKGKCSFQQEFLSFSAAL